MTRSTGSTHAEFTKATGIDVGFNAIPHDSIRQQFVQDALSGAGGFDVYIADQVWLPEFYEKGFIADISSELGAADKADFSKTALETVTYKGAIVALPIMVHNCAMYYRTDLLKAAGIDGPPKTWDEILPKALTATRLNSSTSRPAATRQRPAKRPSTPTRARRRSKPMKCLRTRPRPRAFSELPDMQGAWLNGKLALAPVWPYLYALSKKPLERQVRDRDGAGSQGAGRHGLFLGFAAAAGSKNPTGRRGVR